MVTVAGIRPALTALEQVFVSQVFVRRLPYGVLFFAALEGLVEILKTLVVHRQRVDENFLTAQAVQTCHCAAVRSSNNDLLHKSPMPLISACSSCSYPTGRKVTDTGKLPVLKSRFSVC